MPAHSSRINERLKEKTMNKVAIGFGCALVLAAGAVILRASSPIGVTSTLVGRGTYLPFRVKTDDQPKGGPNALLDYEAAAKTVLDTVVQTHDYAPGASTGWHSHPGPVFITVVQGQLTFYEADDASCRPIVVYAGQGYVDTGHGHIGRNETGLPAKGVTVAIAPLGAPFRSELPAPQPQCGF
jgi:hypothetical protein